MRRIRKNRTIDMITGTILVFLLGVCLPDVWAAEESSEQILIFDEVWQLVNEHFYDPEFNGINWKERKEEYAPQVEAAESFDEAAVIINRMLAELQTSHTVLYTQSDPEYYQLLDVFKAAPLGEEALSFLPGGLIAYSGIGIITKTIDRKVFISGILEGSPADNVPQIQTGCQILSVNGQLYHPINSLRGLAGQEVTMNVQCSADAKSRQELKIVPEIIQPGKLFLSAMEQSVKLIPRNGQNIGYVHIWSYAGEDYHDLL